MALLLGYAGLKRIMDADGRHIVLRAAKIKRP
jgi:hypothetical protein